MVWRHLAAGEVLFEQGDRSDAAYFVVAGRLRVSQRGADGSSQLLAELGRGDVVGELGLLDHAPRSATVRAVRDSTLAALSADVFEGLIAKSPALMLYVGLLDGYLKLKTGSDHATIARDVLLYAIAAGAMIRATVGREHISLPPLTGWVVAWLVVVAAEMIAVNSGLGYLIIDARNAGKRYDLVVAGMVLIGLIGLTLDGLIRQAERLHAVKWAYGIRHD